MRYTEPYTKYNLQDIREGDTILLGDEHYGLCPGGFNRGGRYWFKDADDGAVHSLKDHQQFRLGDVILFLGLARILTAPSTWNDERAVRRRVVTFLCRGRVCWAFRDEFDEMCIRVLNCG